MKRGEMRRIPTAIRHGRTGRDVTERNRIRDDRGQHNATRQHDMVSHGMIQHDLTWRMSQLQVDDGAPGVCVCACDCKVQRWDTRLAQHPNHRFVLFTGLPEAAPQPGQDSWAKGFRDEFGVASALHDIARGPRMSSGPACPRTFQAGRRGMTQGSHPSARPPVLPACAQPDLRTAGRVARGPAALGDVPRHHNANHYHRVPAEWKRGGKL